MKKIWQRNNKRKSLSDNNNNSNSSNNNLNSNSTLNSNSSASHYNHTHSSNSREIEDDNVSIITNDLSKISSNTDYYNYNYNYQSTSVSSTPSTAPTSNNINTTPIQYQQSQLKRNITSLIKLNYDNKVSKNNWCNVVINSNLVNDINENLKLYRCELRGSCLYLYKPANNLNIKSFKLINNDVNINLLNSIKSITDNDTESGQISSTNMNAPKEPSQESDDDEEIVITYFNTKLPHPDLKFDPVNGNQVVGGSVESIVHFILFNDDESQVNQLINLLPLFNNFKKFLEFFNLFGKIFNSFENNISENNSNISLNPTASINKKIETQMIERFKKILANIFENFFGILLIKEIFQLILELLDFISIFENIDEFKSQFFHKQQSLINLTNGPLSEHSNFNTSSINNSVNNTSSTLDKDINPLHVLNSKNFLTLNLHHLSTQINAIDLKFNTTWNQQIDKSLLISTNLSQFTYFKKNPLIFNNNSHVHYLSRLLINHILIEKVSLETKARLLEKWIELGCLLDKSGNMVSWLGISTIILSQGILRLHKVWTLVGEKYVRILKNDWSPVVFELDRRILIDFKNSYHVIAPRGLGRIYSKVNVIPFFGDLIIYNGNEIGFTTLSNSEKGTEKGNSNIVGNIRKYDKNFKRIKYSFNRWDDYLNNVEDNLESIALNCNILKNYSGLSIELSNDNLNNILNIGLINENSSSNPNNTSTNISNNANTSTATGEEEINLDDKFEKLSINDEDHSNIRNKLEKLDSMSQNKLKHSTTNHSSSTSTSIPNLTVTENDVNLQKNLYKLLELNSDSWNLEKIMKFSLEFEPNLAENYLSPPSTTSIPPTQLSINTNSSPFQPPSFAAHNLSSPISSNFNSSYLSSPTTPTTPITPNMESEESALNKLPLFNNSFFKINLSTYDESIEPIITLPLPASASTTTVNETDNENEIILINENLVFKIDDFESDVTDEFADGDFKPKKISTAVSTNTDFQRVKSAENEAAFEDVGSDTEDTDSAATKDREKEKVNKEKAESENEGESKNEVSSIDEEIITDDTTNNGDEIVVDAVSAPTSIKKLKLIPKYTSLDNLVDLLIIDSTFFYNQFNLKLNLNEFRLIFLLNYSSFTSTHNLLSQLTKKFIHSKNVVVSIMKNEKGIKQANFPDWEMNDEGYEIDYNLLLTVQINIIKTLIILIDNFYENFIIDLKNKLIVIDLLKVINNEILQWYNLNKVEKNIEQNFEKLINYYKKLRKIFIRKTYRPIEINESFEEINKSFKFNNTLHEVPMNKNLPNHKNLVKVEKFLNKFNNYLKKFYSLINLKDWFEVFKIFEIQFEKNSLLNFNLQKTNVSEDNLIISNIFNYLETLYDPSKNELILLKFPIIFKKLFKLYFKFKNYLLVQLTDLTVTVDERMERMKTLLIMTKISKLKMSAKNLLKINGIGSIPSFIETALTNVIYSPESRSFTNIWIKASQSLNSNKTNIKFDTLSDLLPKISLNSLVSKNDCYLPCFGWIIENLIEINKIPNFNLNKKLINFNKRYLIFKFVKNLDNVISNLTIDFEENNEFEFLINLSDNLIDYKNLKEFNHLEKEKNKLFKRIINDEYKILRMDNNKKIIKENKIILKKNSNSSLKRQSINYKLNSNSRFKISGIFNKSRPFSLNVPTFNSSSGIDRSINSNELPNPEHFVDVKQKPILIIPLKNKKIFPVYILPCCFKIEIEQSNEEFLFQATSDSDLNDWIVKLNYANRHWFFSKNLNSKHTSFFTTFGIPIEIICNRENSLSPVIIDKILNEIETIGLKDIGIYRISPSYNDLNYLKSEIDSRGDFNFGSKKIDIHTLTSCIKLYFRELPDALITDNILDDLFNFKSKIKTANSNNQNDLFQGYKIILSKLPLYNYHTLKRLMLHLKKVNSFSDVNKMTSSNLATVIGPAITEPSSSDLLINNFGFINPIIEQFINYYDDIFNDA